jgi:CRISPR-associated protein Cas2
MWMLVMFDLPVTEDDDRHRATKFRKFLLDEGFNMSQFSVYLRFCGTRDKIKSYVRKIDANVPPNGKVSILCFTDKQYGKIVNFSNRQRSNPPKKSQQYVLFDLE